MYTPHSFYRLQKEQKITLKGTVIRSYVLKTEFNHERLLIIIIFRKKSSEENA